MTAIQYHSLLQVVGMSLFISKLILKVHFKRFFLCVGFYFTPRPIIVQTVILQILREMAPLAFMTQDFVNVELLFLLSSRFFLCAMIHFMNWNSMS